MSDDHLAKMMSGFETYIKYLKAMDFIKHRLYDTVHDLLGLISGSKREIEKSCGGALHSLREPFLIAPPAVSAFLSCK